ncbi:hypothetical protein HDU87_008296 [Geranomyces variabilis]|uniref:BRCT domain-containing protein n=1 Tax=Geranomyces variabilis TaxID=109894 RepID=A0AAD5TCU1_9FUNG|nr:hypothetical protein HDU87_008296 [Geranomyces variabilis]
MDKFVVRKKRKCDDKIPPENPPKMPIRAFDTTFYTHSGCGHQVYSGVRQANYIQVRRQKLAKQGPEPVSDLLKGVKVYINGYMGMDDLELRHLVVQHGGKIAMGLALRTVTHLVCTSLCEKKKHALLNGKIASVKVVRKEWILDSIQQSKKLPENSYRLFSNPVSSLSGD